MSTKIGVVLCAALAAACGGRVGGETGIAPPSSSTEGCDPNPYGTCYPTSDLGTNVRTGQEGPAGDRIPNFRFLGFKAKSANVGPTSTLQSQILSLADFYDPAGLLGYTVIHIAVNTAWCGPSNEEADYIAGSSYAHAPGFAKELAPLGVVFLEVLTDGPVLGKAATIQDLRNWVSLHQVDYSVAVDGDYGSLGSFFDGAAIPFNIDIDARSMEILAAALGFNTALDTGIKSWVEWESTHPPK